MFEQPATKKCVNCAINFYFFYITFLYLFSGLPSDQPECFWRLPVHRHHLGKRHHRRRPDHETAERFQISLRQRVLRQVHSYARQRAPHRERGRRRRRCRELDNYAGDRDDRSRLRRHGPQCPELGEGVGV